MNSDAENQKEAIHDRIVEIAREVLNLQPGQPEISGDTKFTDDLGAESLDMAQFVMSLEEEYQEPIEDEQIMGLITVQDTVDYIYNRFIKTDG